MFHFCNTAEVATELVVFHANSASIYTVCLTVTFWAAEFCPRQWQKVAQQLCKVWQGIGWPGSWRLCLVKFDTGDCNSGWLEKPLSLSLLLQLSSHMFPASLAAKNTLHGPYRSCFCLVRSTSSKCHGSYTQGIRKAGGLSCR